MVSKKMVSLLCYQSDMKRPRATMGITGGSKETPLTAVRLCGMEVPLSKALDISGSVNLKGKHKGLRVILL